MTQENQRITPEFTLPPLYPVSAPGPADQKNKYVIVKEGLLTNIISDKGFLQHSIINIVDFKANNTNLNEDYQYVLERKLLAFDHLVYSLVNTNRLNRP